MSILELQKVILSLKIAGESSGNTGSFLFECEIIESIWVNYFLPQ